LILKSLEIQGFKSFPDKITLKFNEGITAVVGPNGSGKSNISDAIRWVMGEQSTKNLRGAKMEDVVFFGTEERKAQGFAEVTLTVDNSDRRIDFDSDEISITRKYYRSGESEYRVNGASVRLKDIHEMLMDTGLGRDGYSIVSQGKITAIVDSKSGERREMFEEAAGISKFRYRKLEAERKLVQTEDNLVRLRDILTELESRVGPLKEQSEKAKKFLEYAGEKKGLEIGLWLSILEKSTDSLREWDNKLAICRTQQEQADADMEKIAAEIEEVFRVSAELSSKIEEINLSSSKLEEEAIRSESEAAIIKNDIAHNISIAERINADLEQSINGADALLADIEAKKQEIDQLNGEIFEKNSQITDVLTQLETKRKGESEQSEVIERLSKELNSLTFEQSEIKVQIATSSSAINEIESRKGEISVLLEENEQKRNILEKDIEENKRVLKDITEKISSLTNSVEGYSFIAQKRTAKQNELKEAADKNTLDLQEKQRRIKIFDDLEKNLDGFAHSVKAIMSEAEKGRLRGIHGPLIKLIEVSGEYSVAVETALGAAANNIVVDTEDDAKRAVNFLKQKDAGRATFLPVSTIKGKTLNERGIENCEGFVGVAAELVEFDNKFKDIVNNHLGKVVVVEDLDCAILMARKFGYRFRIVTLDGQVINAGGSITGGSGNKNAGLLSRRAKTDRLREEVKSLSEKGEQLKERLKEAASVASAAQAELIGARAELSNAGEDKIRFESESRMLAGQLDAVGEEEKRLKGELESSIVRTQALNGKLLELNKRCDEVSCKINEIEEQIEAVSGDRSYLTKERESLSARYQELKLDVVARENKISAANDSIIDIENRRKDYFGRLDSMKAEREELFEKNNVLTIQAQELEQKAQSLREQSKANGEQCENIRQEKISLEQKSSDLRRAEREKSSERENIVREAVRLEERKVSVQKQYDDIVKKLWDEYELTRSEAENQAADIENINAAQRRVAELKNKIRALGNVNIGAIEEYAEVSERFEFMSVQVGDVERSKVELLKMISDFTGQMRDIFTERFSLINKYFGETFKELFGGGEARLELTEPEDVLTSGIAIFAQPPGKNIGRLESLSGGEKSLIAIAIYFAIMKVNPAPFCVLDEIEAALDDVNVDRFANYLRRMCKGTQFIVITHRRGTMEEADVIYGVTMQNRGISKLLELNVSEIEEKLGI